MNTKRPEIEMRKYYNNDDSGKVFLLVILFQLLLSLVVSLLIGQIAAAKEIDPKTITSNIWYILANVALNILVYFLVYFLFSRYRQIELKAVKVDFKMKWHTYFIVVAIGIIALLGSQYFIGAVDELLKIVGYPLSSGVGINPTNFGSFILAVVIYCLVPAVCEELIFRGIIFNGLNRRFKTPVAITLSALLFALFHVSLQQLVYPFILGMIMAWVVARTGSIVASMIIHFVNNFLVVLMAYLSNVTSFSMDLPHVWWSYLVAAALLLVMGLIFFLIDKFYFKGKNKEEIEKEEKTSVFLYVAISVGVAIFLVMTILNFVIK